MGLLWQHRGYGQMAHRVVTPGGVVPGIILADTSALYYLRASHTGSLYQMETRIRGPFLGVGIGHRVHSRGDSGLSRLHRSRSRSALTAWRSPLTWAR